ncbi:putative peptidyl-tRNA hydrolase PTRHD1, partial [Mucuna pruriens]
MVECVRVSLPMTCTIPFRLFTPSGSYLAFPSNRIRVTLSHLHAPSISDRASGLSSNSMSQPVDPNATVSTNDAPSGPENADVVVQYVVLRRDLIDTWPLGSVVTQGCHASVSAVWSNKDDPFTVDYCSPDKIDSMHKVTLEVKGETQIKNLSEKLTSGGIIHKLWIEQPENIPTCLATKPYPKSIVSSYFKKLKLCK